MKRQYSSLEGSSLQARPPHFRSRTTGPEVCGRQPDMTPFAGHPDTSSQYGMQQCNWAAPRFAMGPYGTPVQVPHYPFHNPMWNNQNPWDMSKSSLPFSKLQSNIHPAMQFDPKPLEGPGMNFYDLECTPPTFGTTPKNFEDVKINDFDLGESNQIVSPARRSSTSSSGSMDLSELSAVGPQSSVNAPVFESMNAREDRSPRPTHRHSRSLSRNPASRAASKRRHRRQVSCTPGHPRNLSGGGFAPSMPALISPTALQDERPQQTMAGFDFTNSVTSSSPLNIDSIFDTAFDASFDTLMSAGTDLSEAKSLTHDSLMHSSPQQALWDNNAQMNFQASQMFVPYDSAHHRMEMPHHQIDEEKPDLYESLKREPCLPSKEDRNPEDPDMVLVEQDSRFDGDLYTPRFVRGQGNKREGFCGLCPGGRWLVLKNSAHWYDKSFTHGISAATGQPFESPRDTRRMAGNPDVWEGLCGSCGEWIALISSKKKGTTWFRHAYKVSRDTLKLASKTSLKLTLLQCHNYQKAKDTPKKARRDASPANSVRGARQSSLPMMMPQGQQPLQVPTDSFVVDELQRMDAHFSANHALFQERMYTM